jgi:hypothetical protein
MLSLNIVPRSSAALLIMAGLLLLIPNYPVLVLAATIGTGVGVALLYLMIDERDALRFSWLLGASLIIAYAGGTLSTWFSSLSFDDFTYLTKQRPLGLLCGSLAFVYISAGIVLVAGQFEAPLFRSEDELPVDTRFSVILSSTGLVLIILAYLAGDLGFEGVQVDQLSQRISVLGATATLIAAPLAGLFGYMYGRFDAKIFGLYSVFGAGGVILSIIPSGRRQIILALIMLVLGYSLSGALRRRSLLQKMLMAAVVLGIGSLVSSYFFALRLAVWELGSNSSFTSQLSLAFDFMTSTTLEGRFNALLYDNLRERTFVLGYLADLIEATRKSGPLYGEAFLFYLKLSIPSVLDPSKLDVLAIQQIESFAHPKLGLPVIDQANTILTDGITDFGLIGGFLYLSGIVVMLRGGIWFLRRFYRPFTNLIASLTLVHLALKPEITLSEYLVTLRNLIWVIPLMFVCEHIWCSAFERNNPKLPESPRLYELGE